MPRARAQQPYAAYLGRYTQGKRLTAALLILVHFGLLPRTVSLVAAPTALDQRLKEQRQELKELKGQLKDYKDRLERTKRRQHTILQDLDDSERLLQQKNHELRAQERQLKAEAERYAALVKQMQRLDAQLQTQRGLLHQRLRALYKQGRVGYLPFLLSAADVTDFLQRARFTMKVAAYDAALVRQYRDDLNALERTRRAVKVREEQLAQAKQRVTARKEEIEQERLKKNQILTKIRAEQETYESATQELEQASTRLLALITQLERQRQRALAREARERRRRQARQRSRSHDTAPSTDHNGDASHGLSDFAALRGRLPWPLTGKLISTYGRVKHPTFDIYTFNNGISIAAAPGSAFRVIEAGQVLYANRFKGYGNLLIVDHGDGYYSLYAYASELLVRVGDHVSQHQVVGKTGEEGSLDGPALYFEIRHHGKPENPLEWLADHRP